MGGKIVFAFLAGSIFGLTLWGFFVGATVWEEGKRTGAFLQEQKMNRTLVDIGNPEMPACYIQVPLNSVNELAQAGVFQWVYACLEEHSQ
jgi:hypothetical protein